MQFIILMLDGSKELSRYLGLIMFHQKMSSLQPCWSQTLSSFETKRRNNFVQTTDMQIQYTYFYTTSDNFAFLQARRPSEAFLNVYVCVRRFTVINLQLVNYFNLVCYDHHAIGSYAIRIGIHIYLTNMVTARNSDVTSTNVPFNTES